MKYFPRVAKRKIGDILIEGASVSAYGTALGFPEMNLCIDMGICPYSFITFDNLLITHGHQDHILEISRYVALRNMQKIAPPRIFVPEFLLPAIDDLLQLWSRIEQRAPHKYELLPVQAGQRYHFHGNLYFEPFVVQHSLPAFGYKIYELRKKLRDEFRNCTGPELVALKKQGQEIEREVWRPLLLHSGDTNADIFAQPDLSDFPLLIIECTFVENEHLSLARQRQHLHIQTIRDNLGKLGDSRVLLSHFSMRYPENQVFAAVRRVFPEVNERQIFLLWEDRLAG
jgi:ribonuclease Z